MLIVHSRAAKIRLDANEVRAEHGQKVKVLCRGSDPLMWMDPTGRRIPQIKPDQGINRLVYAVEVPPAADGTGQLELSISARLSVAGEYTCRSGRMQAIRIFRLKMISSLNVSELPNSSLESGRVLGLECHGQPEHPQQTLAWFLRWPVSLDLLPIHDLPPGLAVVTRVKPDDGLEESVVETGDSSSAALEEHGLPERRSRLRLLNSPGMPSEVICRFVRRHRNGSLMLADMSAGGRKRQADGESEVMASYVYKIEPGIDL
ncbi:unnamed protein product [Protopolystoma xenopodis]|uniref:Uncharacterized protein n=1 Tax=Protopolystoma xenopodis TaxID=117903 RepID=A0A448XCB2_9PLAT|nr:unnamed protein product [Protopolystoma xenopodis]